MGRVVFYGLVVVMSLLVILAGVPVHVQSHPVPPPDHPEHQGREGCTPGYWKQDQHFDSWPTGISPSDQVTSVFSNGPSGTTLLDALQGGGGPGVAGARQILLRAAVAAYLNARHPDVHYPLLSSDIVSAVNLALASGNRTTMLNLAAQLDALNNLGCPLN